MEQRPLISVITVVYNAEKVLEETLQSIFSQDYKNLEVVIVDGASKDGTLDIIKKYQDRIGRWISEPDKGLYDAMNKGLSLASGEWITFLNAGDSFTTNDTVSKMFAADPSAVDVIYGDAILTAENYENYVKPKSLSVKNLRAGHSICHQSMFVRKSRAPKYDLNLRFKAEYNWIIDIMTSIPADRVRYVPVAVVYYALGGFGEKWLLKNLKEYIAVTRKRFGLSQVILNLPMYSKIFLRHLKYKFVGYNS